MMKELNAAEQTGEPLSSSGNMVQNQRQALIAAGSICSQIARSIALRGPVTTGGSVVCFTE
ncbi:MAG TPA: hypothetical protein DC058_11655 [Planctomycetaceae bacterium]|nr:hypothetical protein [Planctomycetaceae bacterium]HBC61858.1 hypothetical protein [Planctomycetaceae bacterium]